MSTFLLTVLILLAALLYASVGHGGASGYLAAMALFNVAPGVMKPTALSLNLLVAGIGTYRYARAGCFCWHTFWPFAAASVPLAFAGGACQVSGHAYRVVLGLVLFFAAWRMAVKQSEHARSEAKPVNLPVALLFGGAIGFLSGLTGVGGGIFLSPLLLMLGWVEVRKSAGISAAFILVNSAAGLLGHSQSVQAIPHEVMWWAPAAVLGGWLGSELGTRHLKPMTMRRILAAVLVVAGAKLIFAH